MKLSDFDYYLPKEFIAQYPLRRRDSSRLLVLDRNKAKVYHRKFPDILDYFNRGDCIVLNDTRVIPARLIGYKEESKGKVELLLLERGRGDIFRSLLKPSRRVKKGDRIIFGREELVGEIVDDASKANGIRMVHFHSSGNLKAMLARLGQIPLPPYIKRSPQLLDKRRYQTVYAKSEGSIAAPTAGLHFTPRLLEKLRLKGIKIVYLTLHVGYATFKPVTGEDIDTYHMGVEHFEISQKTARALNATRTCGKKIISVGTTTCRVLETVAKSRSFSSPIFPQRGQTELFIYPPYEFKLTDNLLTNFHLPKTTLLMLVSAFCDKDILLSAYKEAVERRYRFYSYGDAMLVI